MLCAIQNLRMICDSTFLFDKETKVSSKMEELNSAKPNLFGKGREIIVTAGRMVAQRKEHQVQYR